MGSFQVAHVSGPIKGLYRELKRRLGKRVRLVDEYRTSIICSTCNGRMDKRSRFWSLKTLWNRDTNAARNILRLFFYMNSNNGERLEEFRNRGGEESVATSG
ncbi:9394_t:CDS:2, partial [Gigaspora rosea]